MTAGAPSAQAVDRVATLLHARYGLRADPSLRTRLARCIRDEAAQRGQDAEQYVDSLPGSGTLQSLLNRTTVQETAFFRHPEHFAVLAREILPMLPRPVRIWSAGCANGQEAYSLAMVLAEQGVDGAVVATDLSTDALERTTAARYSPHELTGLSAARRTRHLTQRGRQLEVNAALRARVTVLRHSLVEPMPDQVRSSHVVFCRNVLIYISPEHTKAFLAGVADGLPDCWLFLGSAETMWTLTDRFATVQRGDAYVYRPTEPAAVRRLAPGPRPPVPLPPALPPAPPAPRSATEHPLADPTPELARTGVAALDRGESATAVVAFRKWAYLAPDDPVAHLHLGLALEAAGDDGAAQRAYGAARRSLSGCPAGPVEQALGGYSTAELGRLLDAKQREAAT